MQSGDPSLKTTEKSLKLYGGKFMSKTSFNIDIDDIVYTMTISISTFINCKTNCCRYNDILHKMMTSTSISTLISWKTYYDVDINDIVHKMTISTSISINII